MFQNLSKISQNWNWRGEDEEKCVKRIFNGEDASRDGGEEEERVRQEEDGSYWAFLIFYWAFDKQWTFQKLFSTQRFFNNPIFFSHNFDTEAISYSGRFVGKTIAMHYEKELKKENKVENR